VCKPVVMRSLRLRSRAAHAAAMVCRRSHGPVVSAAAARCDKAASN